MSTQISKRDIETIRSGLKLVAENRELLGKVLEELDLNMPNLKTPTLGGAVFWEDLVSSDGWRVQKNKVFGNCRIIDPENVRVAWGGESAMVNAFDKIANGM